MSVTAKGSRSNRPKPCLARRPMSAPSRSGARAIPTWGSSRTRGSSGLSGPSRSDSMNSESSERGARDGIDRTRFEVIEDYYEPRGDDFVVILTGRLRDAEQVVTVEIEGDDWFCLS